LNDDLLDPLPLDAAFSFPGFYRWLRQPTRLRGRKVCPELLLAKWE
jgi:hypothetical protein